MSSIKDVLGGANAESNSAPVKEKKAPPGLRKKRNRKALPILLALTVGIGAAGAALAVVNSQKPNVVEVYATSGDMRANQVLTDELLTTIAVDANALPGQPLTAEQLGSAAFFARADIPAGTPITLGVFQTSRRTIEDLPPGYVVGSFQISPELAVAGRVQAGDFIDIFVISEDATTGERISRLALSKVEVLNVQAALDSAPPDGEVEAEAQPGPDAALYYGGVPEVYTVAVTPEQAAILTLIQESAKAVFLTTPDAPVLDVSVSESQASATGKKANSAPTPAASSPAAPTPTATPSPAASVPADKPTP